MAASGGAPWWVTGVLTLVSVGATHFFTVSRERGKAGRERVDRWRVECLALVAKITDASITHYVDQKSFADTPKSAALILSDLKRLSHLLRESHCVAVSETKKTMDLFRAYHTTITGPEEFQDTGRVSRAANDPLCDSIRDIEGELKKAIKKPRK